MKNKNVVFYISILVLIALFLAFILLPAPGTDMSGDESVHYQQSSQNTTKPKGDVTIAILSVNDMHSAIDNMPRFASLVDSLREVYPDLLVFSAGDNRTGNPINDQYDPTNRPMITLMNAVGFDLSAVGNHEWDGGLDALQNDINEAMFPFLCANINLPSDIPLGIKPYSIIENQGVRIAVVGLIEARSGIPGAHPKHFTKISFRKPLEVASEYQFLHDKADVVILLSHLGFEDDLEVAKTCPFYDEIIGGHSHTLVENPECHNGVLVTQAGSGLRDATLSLITIKNREVIDKRAVNLNVEYRDEKNQDIQCMVDDFNEDTRFREALSTALSPFDTKEELGCLITDAIREVSDADFAFTNTGGIRINRLQKGAITIKDVYNIDPFNNDVIVFSMTGRQVERFIMESYKKNGRYPSPVSGMTYKVNTASDGYPSSVSIQLPRGNFKRDATYTVAMNSYVASTVRFESLDDGKSLFMTSEEMLIEYLRNHRTISYQGISRVE